MERQYYYESHFYEWHSVHQLPFWVKKGFGWNCPKGTGKPCSKHGIFDYQHPKYLRGRWFEYMLKEKPESVNIFDSVSRRAFPVRIPPLKKVSEEFLNKWTNITTNVPEWLLEEIERQQIDRDPFFKLGSKNWIIQGRYSIYRVIIEKRGKISSITRRRKKKEYPGYLQY